jgi:hypothetical protein
VRIDHLSVGLGMVPRGKVGLFATLGKKLSVVNGAKSEEVFDRTAPIN